MPTYVWKCRTCGSEFEVSTTVGSRDRHRRCECGSDATYRLEVPPGFGVQFKGGGWGADRAGYGR